MTNLPTSLCHGLDGTHFNVRMIQYTCGQSIVYSQFFSQRKNRGPRIAALRIGASAHPATRTGPLARGEMPVQSIEQLFAPRAIAAAKLRAFRAHERLGIEEIRVNEAREEHPRVECEAEAGTPVRVLGARRQ